MAREKILFIDNRPDHLSQPVLRLQLEGYNVHAAEDGQAGLRELASGDYDLLILDSELPQEDGWNVLREVRRDPHLERLKVIVLMAPHGETGQLALVPVDAELRRPFSIGRLLETVQRVLSQEDA